LYLVSCLILVAVAYTLKEQKTTDGLSQEYEIYHSLWHLLSGLSIIFSALSVIT